MDKKILFYIKNIEKRKEELNKIIQSPNFFQNIEESAKLTKEYNNIVYIIDNYNEIIKLKKELQNNEQLMIDSINENDEELLDIINKENNLINNKIKDLENNIVNNIEGENPNDSRNTILEIRAGTGGSEASIFASDLHKMYIRYAQMKSWKIEYINSRESEIGGFKEISFLIIGKDVYKNLKYESGVHRVQRIPLTESQGRIHTSTATVAVLPEVTDTEIKINPQDVEIKVCKASGPGGQSVNTTDSAVQLLHKPTNITVYCADERSQQKNRIKAFKVLKARLFNKIEEEKKAEYSSTRKNQIGSGDRAEKIRTYNFPQGRVTDHRINYTCHNIQNIMLGYIQHIIDNLSKEERIKKIENEITK